MTTTNVGGVSKPGEDIPHEVKEPVPDVILKDVASFSYLTKLPSPGFSEI